MASAVGLRDLWQARGVAKAYCQDSWAGITLCRLLSLGLTLNSMGQSVSGKSATTVWSNMGVILSKGGKCRSTCTAAQLYAPTISWITCRLSTTLQWGYCVGPTQYQPSIISSTISNCSTNLFTTTLTLESSADFNTRFTAERQHSRRLNNTEEVLCHRKSHQS